MKTVFIYALKEPDTEKIRYVGVSNNPKNRLRTHFCSAKTGNTHRACWIRSLVRRGLKPVLEIIDEVLDSEWRQLEVAYIDYFRECGCDLVNGTSGGDGMLNPTDETRKNIRQACESRWTRHTHPMLGKKHSETSKELMRASKSGTKQSLEHRANISIGNQGKQMSVSSIEKRTAARRKNNPNYHSTEALIKIVSGIKAAAQRRRENLCPA